MEQTSALHKQDARLVRDTDIETEEEEQEAKDGEIITIPASELPGPESMPEWADLPQRPPKREPVAKGLLGAAVRTVQKIPSCVWVVNEHNEDIVVVVSKYRPDRLLSGVGINASATGAGLNFTTTTFVSPACRKTLAASLDDHEPSMAVFPLWTRKESFGVITIFKGPEQKLYIENDKIPLGATAFFSGKSLRILEYRR